VFDLRRGPYGVLLLCFETFPIIIITEEEEEEEEE